MGIAFTKSDRGVSTTSTYFTHDGVISDSIDIDQARSLLDFQVVTEPICRPNGEEVADIFNLVRTDTNEVLPIGKSVGREFTPMNHIELFDFLKDRILPQMPELKLETVATMYGGASSLITGNFGEEFHLPNDNSGHRTRILFSNPMGRGSLLLGFCSVRVVCQNTLMKARREVMRSADGFKIQHSTNVQYAAMSAFNSILAQVEEAKELREMQTVLANKEVSAEQVRNILNRVYPLEKYDKGSAGYTRAENTRNEVLRQFESGETAQTMDKKTAWSLFNSFTYPIFNPVKTSARTDMAEVAYSGMAGTRADKVSNIFGTVWNEVVEKQAA